jgi:wobble nucleotide-excising tRNase
MVLDGDAATHRLDEGDRDKLLIQHRATPKPKVQQVTYALPDFEAVTADASELLSATVVSAAIQTLRDDPLLSQWTREGLGLHRERNADRCLFCEQPLPTGRLATLEEHFSAQYEQLMQRLDQQIAQLQRASKQALELILPSRAQLYDDLGAEYEGVEVGLREAANAMRHFLDAVAQALTDKKDRFFESMTFNLTVPAADFGAVDRLNEVIRKHNQACDGFQKRVDAARRSLALDMIAADLDEFVRLKEAVQHAVAEVRAADQELQGLTREITRLEREIVEHRQPAEELNADLHKYLGHDELRLEIKDIGYAITRNGVPAETLSEGETTAIALLYFLKSLRDRRFDLRKGVVVLDDPVSSLDANALYLAFGFIRERTRDAGQLFIFTHNFTFFRQVRNWFHRLPGQNKRDVSQRPARFYMLDCISGQGQRRSAIVPLDPLLEQYESEYHYLFSRIYREAFASSAGLEENYLLPNMARRVLEAFLAFRQPQVAGDLWRKMEDVDFDETKKLRILRFVHTYSHGDSIGEPQHDPSLLGEARSVLRDLLEFIKAQDANHFVAMEELVRQPEAEEDGA